jgi:hypothetical protein
MFSFEHSGFYVGGFKIQFFQFINFNCFNFLINFRIKIKIQYYCKMVLLEAFFRVLFVVVRVGPIGFHMKNWSRKEGSSKKFIGNSVS